MLRAAARVLVPDALKRRHERWVTERYLDAINGPTAEYLRRYGTAVRHGPFAGMEYDPEGQSWSNDVVAKLTGTYELELHDALRAWIAAGPAHVVDVGCAEGYYAVGLARALPGAQVHAYDIDAAARAQTAALAQRNGVAARVQVAGECTPATLRTLPAERVALLADCEGYERTLLDPAAAPNLARWDIVVELHEFLDPGIADTIAERFAATHEIALVTETGRAATAPPELAFLEPGVRAKLLDERRPARMRWAVLSARGGAKPDRAA
jgi:hypothetical protein